MSLKKQHPELQRLVLPPSQATRASKRRARCRKVAVRHAQASSHAILKALHEGRSYARAEMLYMRPLKVIGSEELTWQQLGLACTSGPSRPSRTPSSVGAGEWPHQDDMDHKEDECARIEQAVLQRLASKYDLGAISQKSLAIELQLKEQQQRLLEVSHATHSVGDLMQDVANNACNWMQTWTEERVANLISESFETYSIPASFQPEATLSTATLTTSTTKNSASSGALWEADLATPVESLPEVAIAPKGSSVHTAIFEEPVQLVSPSDVEPGTEAEKEKERVDNSKQMTEQSALQQAIGDGEASLSVTGSPQAFNFGSSPASTPAGSFPSSAIPPKDGLTPPGLAGKHLQHVWPDAGRGKVEDTEQRAERVQNALQQAMLNAKALRAMWFSDDLKANPKSAIMDEVEARRLRKRKATEEKEKKRQAREEQRQAQEEIERRRMEATPYGFFCKQMKDILIDEGWDERYLRVMADEIMRRWHLLSPAEREQWAREAHTQQTTPRSTSP